MTASTTITITCTKSEFGARLRNEFVNGAIDARANVAELNEVIDGLVKQANNHRGTFAGHSAYLDCDFTVTPDDPSMANCAACGGSPEYPARNCIASFHDVPITIAPLPKTMADYRPGTAVRRMLSELSYLSNYNVSQSALRMVLTSVDAECGEQGITEHLVMPLNEINTWIAEEVAEIIASRD